MKSKLQQFAHDLIAYIVVGGAMAIMVVCFFIPQ
jgi:hypothetical protein